MFPAMILTCRLFVRVRYIVI